MSNIFQEKNVRVKGVEPPRREALDPKSSMSTSSITPAFFVEKKNASVFFEYLESFYIFRRI